MLNAINTYTGATAINVGTLKLDTSGARDAASRISIAAGIDWRFATQPIFRS